MMERFQRNNAEGNVVALVPDDGKSPDGQDGTQLARGETYRASGYDQLGGRKRRMNDSDATRGPCDTAAALVHQLYIEELKRALMPPVHPMVNGEQTQALIRSARGMGRATCEEPDETTWIWSDLHLGDEMSLEVFDRPFRTVHEADREMMTAWRDVVDIDDTIVCLGDIGVDGSVDETKAAQWNDAPGIKWLVVGNHENK